MPPSPPRPRRPHPVAPPCPQVPLASSSRSYTVALPSVHEDWSWAFYSCNGLDKPENKQSTRGMEPMWRDVVERHAQRPFHALVGGGQRAAAGGAGWRAAMPYRVLPACILYQSQTKACII